MLGLEDVRRLYGIRFKVEYSPREMRALLVRCKDLDIGQAPIVYSSSNTLHVRLVSARSMIIRIITKLTHAGACTATILSRSRTEGVGNRERERGLLHISIEFR